MNKEQLIKELKQAIKYNTAQATRAKLEIEIEYFIGKNTAYVECLSLINNLQ